MQRENTNVRNTSLRVPKGVEGFVYAVHILPPKEADVIALAAKKFYSSGSDCVITTTTNSSW